MKNYLKNELKHIPLVLILFILFYGITTLATTTLFASSEVKYNNSTSGIQSDKVQGAIDELYACASNYGAYNTRLTNTENTIGTGSLTTTSQTLIGGINELNSNSGVTAGTYGPSANVNGANGNTISVPQITVNAKGKITSISNKTYTSVNTDTNTWRGIQNNLTSSSTSDCLSAAQGKVLNDKIIYRSGTVGTITIPANSMNVITWSPPTISGYTCIGWSFGVNHDYIWVQRNGIEGKIDVRNLYSGGAQTVTVTYACIYIKN